MKYFFTKKHFSVFFGSILLALILGCGLYNGGIKASAEVTTEVLGNTLTEVSGSGTLNVAENIEDIKLNVSETSEITDICVADGNKNFKVYEGGLYSADYSTLYLVSAGNDTLKLHPDVKKICDDSREKNHFVSIECDASNENFCVENNVLYNKDKTEIIIFPSKMTEYTMPETVSDISVITNEFCNDSEDEMFVRYNNVASNLEKIDVHSGNKKYVAIDGVLYNKSKTELVLYPESRNGVYVMPKSVKKADSAVFCSARKLTQLTISINKTFVLNGCTSLKKVKYTEGVNGVKIYGNLFGETGTKIDSIYLPSTIRYIEIINVGKGATVYGYQNTGDYEYDLSPIADIKKYVISRGYKFKNLGTAPTKVKSAKATIKGSNVKVNWKSLSGAKGYKISFVPDKKYRFNEVVLKQISGVKKTSCTIKKSKLKGKKKIYIRAYKVINGIKVYGKAVEITCK